MAKSAVELDFFRMEKENTSKTLERRRSFRDIQGGISKLSPEVLKSVIGSVPSRDQSPNVAASYTCKSENISETAPFTVFYNGTVAVFDLPSDEVGNILKMACKAVDANTASSSSNQCQFPVAIDGDLPIARRKSLQRFLAKRQQRATLSSPYFCPEKNTSSKF